MVESIFTEIMEYLSLKAQVMDWAINPDYRIDMLELGPGTGTLTEKILSNPFRHELYRSLSFVEPEEIAINFTVDKIKDIYLNPKIFSDILDIEQYKFDVIYGSFVFHHIPDSKKLESVAKARELLKPNGIIIFGEEFLTDYRGKNQKRFATIEYHGTVIDKLLKRTNIFGKRKQADKDMVTIETLAMLNALTNFDESKTSLKKFESIAKRAGLQIQKVEKWFPREDLDQGIYTIVLQKPQKTKN